MTLVRTNTTTETAVHHARCRLAKRTDGQGPSYATRGTVGILIPPAALSGSLSREETLDRPWP